MIRGSETTGVTEHIYSKRQLFESLSRTVTCTRELISIYMCCFQGEGLNTSLSRLSYLILYAVVQLLSSCLVVRLSLYLVSVRYLVPYVLDAHDE